MDTTETTIPSPDALLARVEAMAPLVRDNAERHEQERQLSPEVVAAMCEAGVLRTLLPRRFGGYEHSYDSVVRINWELGRGCASTSWVAAIYMIHQWILAQFPIEVQEEVWADGPDVPISGSYSPAGKCEAADGGYRVTGRWLYASGCDHARWSLISSVMPPDEAGGKPQPGFLLVGPGEFEILDDWYTVGLAGTGSKSVVCDGQFIPRHRRVTFAELSSGSSPGAEAHDRPLYRIPLLACIPYSIASPAVGALQGAIDDFLADVKERETRGAVLGAGNRMSEFQAVQMRIGEAQACSEFARSRVLADLAETHRLADAGEPITVDRRIRNRMTQAFMVKLATQGIEALYGATGGAGLQRSHRIQRAWRDIHGIGHHVSLNWDAVSSMWGQHVLGLEPKGQY